jgi:hypothetical protein
MSAKIIHVAFPTFNPRAAHPRITACDVLPCVRPAPVVEATPEPVAVLPPAKLPWLARIGYGLFDVNKGTAQGIRL